MSQAQAQKFIPFHERDTAWWVTKKLYPCRVPYIQTLSPEYIKFFGMPDSGDEYVNRQMRDELISIQIPIGMMAEYYSQDVTVLLPNNATIKEIYERTNAHLAAWRDEMLTAMNPKEAPIDDLMKLDLFAASLFPHAKPFFESNFFEEQIHRQFGGIMSLSRESLTRRLDESRNRVRPKEEKKEEGPQHQSFSSFFMAGKAELAKSRWEA